MPAPTNTQPMRPAWLRIVDRASVAAFALAWGAVLAALLVHVPPLRLALLGLMALPAAVLLADLASGLVHWFADRYLDPKTPVLGPMLIEPFREHHRDPLAMTRHDFYEVSGNNGLVTLPLALLLLVFAPQPDDSLGLQLARITTVLFAGAIFATNQLHAWAHDPRPPAWVVRLQRRRLILSPEAHARHHRGGYDRAYCVTTGWLNPSLDRLGLFAALESCLAQVGLERAGAERIGGPST